jgi:hypothetical protein
MRKDGFVLFVAAIPKGEYIDFELKRNPLKALNVKRS